MAATMTATVINKACTKCLHLKSLDSFKANKRTRDGLQSWCRECENAHARAKYEENREQQRARSVSYRAEHRAEVAARNRRYRVEHREEQKPAKVVREGRRRTRRVGDALIIYFTAEQLAQRFSMFPGCWICGGPPTQTDHVKPTSAGGAHILANLRPICGPCNQRKKDQWPYALARPLLRG